MSRLSEENDDDKSMKQQYVTSSYYVLPRSDNDHGTELNIIIPAVPGNSASSQHNSTGATVSLSTSKSDQAPPTNSSSVVIDAADYNPAFLSLGHPVQHFDVSDALVTSHGESVDMRSERETLGEGHLVQDCVATSHDGKASLVTMTTSVVVEDITSQSSSRHSVESSVGIILNVNPTCTNVPAPSLGIEDALTIDGVSVDWRGMDKTGAVPNVVQTIIQPCASKIVVRSPVKPAVALKNTHTIPGGFVNDPGISAQAKPGDSVRVSPGVSVPVKPVIRAPVKPGVGSPSRPEGGAPVFSRKLRSTTVVEGEDAEFVCHVTVGGAGLVEWLKDGKPINAQNSNIKVTRDGDVNELSVTKALLGDAGRYVCRAVNQHGEACSMGSLMVLAPPTGSATAIIGPLEAHLRQLNSVSKRLNGPVSVTVRHSPASGNVGEKRTSTSASEVPRGQVGLRWCKPEAEFERSEYRGESGGRVVLVCRVQGHPVPSITWFHEKNIINNIGNSESLKIMQHNTVSQLVIGQLTPCHAGRYVCKAENQLGLIRAHCTLIVTDAEKSNNNGLEKSVSLASHDLSDNAESPDHDDIEHSKIVQDQVNAADKIFYSTEKVKRTTTKAEAKLLTTVSATAEQTTITTECLAPAARKESDLAPEESEYLQCSGSVVESLDCDHVVEGSTTEAVQCESEMKDSDTSPDDVEGETLLGQDRDCDDNLREVAVIGREPASGELASDGRTSERNVVVNIIENHDISFESNEAVVERFDFNFKNNDGRSRNSEASVENNDTIVMNKSSESTDLMVCDEATRMIDSPTEASATSCPSSTLPHAHIKQRVHRVHTLPARLPRPYQASPGVVESEPCEPVSSADNDITVDEATALEDVDEEGLPMIEDLTPEVLSVVRGESFELLGRVVGCPAPSVFWMKGNLLLTENEKIELSRDGEMVRLKLTGSEPVDTGCYMLFVSNQHGTDHLSSSVTVQDVPDPPVGQPAITSIKERSVVLSWYGSSYDGGSPILRYLIEFRQCETSSGQQQQKQHSQWSTVNDNCKHTTHKVDNLKPDTTYQFRIRTGNKYGFSEPGQPSDVIITTSRVLSRSDGSTDNLTDISEADDPLSPIMLDGPISPVSILAAKDELPFPPREVQLDKVRKFLDHYTLGEEIGRGKFGSVCFCKEKSSGLEFAVKFIRVKAGQREEFRKEVDVMNQLRHPKLLLLWDAFESTREIIIVMEHVAGKELLERVINEDYVLTERECIHFMRQICEGVTYMHSQNILHLDLKPENILCVTINSNEIKIIDFGLARRFDPTKSFKVMFGTPEFVAPEVVNYDNITYTTDMWSVGVICYVLLSGLSPFLGDTDTETLSNVTRGLFDFDDEAFDEISDDAKEFIQLLLIPSTDKRLTAERSLNHRWLAQDVSYMRAKRLSTAKHKRFMARRKWQKSGNALRALGRMAALQKQPPSPSVTAVEPGVGGRDCGPHSLVGSKVSAGPPSRDFPTGDRSSLHSETACPLTPKSPISPGLRHVRRKSMDSRSGERVTRPANHSKSSSTNQIKANITPTNQRLTSVSNQRHLDTDEVGSRSGAVVGQQRAAAGSSRRQRALSENIVLLRQRASAACRDTHIQQISCENKRNTFTNIDIDKHTDTEKGKPDEPVLSEQKVCSGGVIVNVSSGSIVGEAGIEPETSANIEHSGKPSVSFCEIPVSKSISDQAACGGDSSKDVKECEGNLNKGEIECGRNMGEIECGRNLSKGETECGGDLIDGSSKCKGNLSNASSECGGNLNDGRIAYDIDEANSLLSESAEDKPKVSKKTGLIERTASKNSKTSSQSDSTNHSSFFRSNIGNVSDRKSKMPAHPAVKPKPSSAVTRPTGIRYDRSTSAANSNTSNPQSSSIAKSSTSTQQSPSVSKSITSTPASTAKSSPYTSQSASAAKSSTCTPGRISINSTKLESRIASLQQKVSSSSVGDTGSGGRRVGSANSGVVTSGRHHFEAQVPCSAQRLRRAPVFVRKLKNQEVMERSNTRFEVRVEGNPPPVVTWYKDGQEIVVVTQPPQSDSSKGEGGGAAEVKDKNTAISDRKGVSLSGILNAHEANSTSTVSVLKYDIGRSDDGKAWLIINQCGEDDDAEYSCRASNELGQVTCKADLYVEPYGEQLVMN